MSPTISQRLLQFPKRVSKRPITSALFHSGYYGSRLRRAMANRAIILAYHRVGGSVGLSPGEWSTGFEHGISLARFESHMRFIREALSPIPLRELAERISQNKPLPPRAIVVTFDDGYRDNFLHAYPILKQYDIPATIFVTTGFVDSNQKFWWDQVFDMLRGTHKTTLDLGALKAGTASTFPLGTSRQKTRVSEILIEWMRSLPPARLPEILSFLRSSLGIPGSEPAGSKLMLTWKQVQEMSQHGIAIEAHTHSHRNLALLTESEVADEFRLSKNAIEKQIGRTIDGLAYPWGLPGTYTDGVTRIAQQLGFRYACVIRPGHIGPGADLFTLKRTAVGNAPLPILVRDCVKIYTAARDQGDEGAAHSSAGAARRKR